MTTAPVSGFKAAIDRGRQLVEVCNIWVIVPVLPEHRQDSDLLGTQIRPRWHIAIEILPAQRIGLWPLAGLVVTKPKPLAWT
jgi:hypothetical protein